MRRTPLSLAAVAAVGASVIALPSTTDAAPPPLAVPDAHAELAGEATAAARDRLHGRAMRVAEKLAAVQGRNLRPDYDEALRTFATDELAAKHRELRRDLRSARRKALARERDAHARGSMPAHLAAIAQCESGGNPAAVGGGGTYRGLFQFSQATWNAVGGTGDPAAASVAEQVKRAQILYARSGPGQWPVCGA